jgi:hypothetical protein
MKGWVVAVLAVLVAAIPVGVAKAQSERFGCLVIDNRTSVTNHVTVDGYTDNTGSLSTWAIVAGDREVLIYQATGRAVIISDGPGTGSIHVNPRANMEWTWDPATHTVHVAETGQDVTCNAEWIATLR